ncbi:MAG: RNA-guided pseudouridylation complex pseudouridine synthase subunit Cbf5 [Candidatus Micrarchaeota archaeon]|nr:RNA-guided pseudouridylation complex pseudouridine synthase subunit Cbf5 [Candidatus Micrarchaeota archaeon]
MNANPEMSVVLIDKPRGMTSFDVVEKVCEITGIKKAGHAGTLDPNVTGLLLIALGEARKCMPLLSGLDKEYEGEMLFHDDITEENVKKLAKEFTGRIKQIPPVKSAVARKERERTVYSFEILKVKQRLVSFRIRCEAGTYIRKICHDMGQAAGIGAHMAKLRRISIGPFDVSETVTLDEFAQNPVSHLMRIEDALMRIGIKRIVIKPENEADVRNGKPVLSYYIEKMDPEISINENIVFFVNGNLIGIGICLSCTANTNKPIARIKRIINRT